MKDSKTYIYGKHAVEEAIAHTPDVVKKVFVALNFTDEKLLNVVRSAKIPVSKMEGRSPGEESQDASHQGIFALVSTERLLKPYEIFTKTLQPTPNTALVLLDELEDPHNVGALIRSSAAFGIAGVLIPSHNQAQITGAVAKVSAGMIFRVPLVQIGNVNETLRDLKERGFWIYGLAGEGKNSLIHEKFDAPAVFIMGNEADGIRQKTRELCDIMLKIPMNPRAESLNVAAAGAVVLYEWSKGHQGVVK